MEYAENHAKDLGFRGIRLWSNPTSTTVNFYERCGYRVVGEEDVNYSNGLSLCVPFMIKEF